jgi:hypothetical protein
MRRLSLSDREALYVLWALEEALLISEPEEEETLSSLISRLQESGAAAPFSSASQALSYSRSLL